MRAAPPVEAALDTGRPERMLITLLHAMAGALLAAWSALHAEWRLGWATLAVGCMAAVLLAALGRWLAVRALPPQPGRLRWDGQSWCAVGACNMPLQRLVLALDLGPWVLLQLHPADGRRPLWRVASARGAQSSWHGLRVALAAHAGAAAPAGGEAAP
jgi:hypothetical protein